MQQSSKRTEILLQKPKINAWAVSSIQGCLVNAKVFMNGESFWTFL
jgi:hypothetical protein